MEKAGSDGAASTELPHESVGPAIFRGRDGGKDQSYVLFGIDRAILERVIFPVGDFDKPDVRKLAQQSGLRVHDKADSQEICFIPDTNLKP